MHFSIDMLPARDGDAFVVSWGDTGPMHRMLIDGGRGGKALNATLGAWFARHPNHRHFDLVVCTHMDADHISGLIGLFHNPPVGFSVGEIWFNAFRHLPTDVLGWKQSDQLERLVDTFVRSTETVWNKTCRTGKAVAVADVQEDEITAPLPHTVVAGLKIILLSPTVAQLARVATEWPARVRAARLDVDDQDETQQDPYNDVLGYDEDAGVAPSELAKRAYTPDRSKANGASIAFLLEFAGKRALFCADAHSETLESTLRRFQPDGTIDFDVIKVSHHGGAKNLSPDFLAMLNCPNWLISTNGRVHHHPDRRAIARLITQRRPTNLIFNYNSDETEEWGLMSLQMEYGFSADLPPKDKPGMVFDVIGNQARSA